MICLENLEFVCPCHFGIESVLSGEIKRMGAENIKTTDGRVQFSGGIEFLPRANLMLRTAERVLLKMGEFEANAFDELFEKTKSLPWENWIGKLDRFPVKGHSINSQLRSVPDCQAIIKKAVVDRLKQSYKINWFLETGCLYRIQFSIIKNVVSLYIDTSGEGLHKRGYRKNSAVAPIKETLACGIIDLAHVKPFSTVYDPFCGSGTFLIESALKAKNIAPGINRNFVSENWRQIGEDVWKNERLRAINLIRSDIDFCGIGLDIDEQAIELSLNNSKKAGVDSIINFKPKDIKTFSLNETETGIVLCNPPYGERLLEKKQAENIIKIMGKVFKKKKGWSYYIISPHKDFEKLFGRNCDKKRKLYNGMLKCNLFMYFK